MTISSTVRRAGPFVGNGIATVFAFTYKVFTASEVVVTRAVTATGVETVLTLNTHYSVALNADQNTNPGGNVTYPISGAPLPSTETLTLTSGVTQLQETDIVNAGGFFPEVIENSLDKATIIVQQETEILNRTPRFPVSDASIDTTLPTAAQRAGKVLGFGGTGAPIAVINVPTGAVPASAFMETMLDDANALTARQTLLIDKKATDVASADSIDLDAPTGDLVDVTGSITITAITLGEGREKTCRFTGAPLLTHGASLVCPGGVNVQLFAGDFLTFRGYAAGVVRVVDGQPNENGLLGKLPTSAGDILVATLARTLARASAFPAPINCQLTYTVAANALTITLKGQNGSDLSATNPALIPFRNVTPATGDYTWLALTANQAFTLSSGSTAGFTSASAGRLWIVGFNDGGTFRLGAINCLNFAVGPPRVVDIFSLAAFSIASSTAEGGAGAADSAHVLYTGTAVASKAYTVLGYATWESGLTTAGTWDALPTRAQPFSADTPLPGREVQSVYESTGEVATGTTLFPVDDTIPQNTEGNEYLDVSITPSSAANVLEVTAFVAENASSGTNSQTAMGVFQDAIANAVSFAVSGRNAVANSQDCNSALIHKQKAGVSVASTFNMRAGIFSAATYTFNGGAGVRDFGGALSSFIGVKELMA